MADGYGQNWVHRYSADGTWKSCFGGRGSEAGQFVTCHGIMLDTRGAEPTLLVSDRENHRLQSFDLEGKHLAVIEADLRRPCNTYAFGEHLVVADLAGQVIFVVAANSTTRNMVADALKLVNDHSRVGLILNKSRKSIATTYGYGYGTPKP